MAELRIAPNLVLPIDVVTQRFGVFGMTDSGKTYFALVLAEEMLAAGAQIVFLDPLGVGWGLKAVAEGSGLDPADLPPLVVLGGEHGDLPLTPDAGAATADLALQEGLSLVLDLKGFESDEDQVRFAAAFASRLYRQIRQHPMHLIVDEADIFAPQSPELKDVIACRRAFDNLVRRTRVEGLGVTLISQRPAVVSKNLMSQVNTLVAMRLAAPQDQGAVENWYRTHAGDEQRKTVMSSLASLPTGDCWVFSPLNGDIFVRTRARPRHTFDSSATPRVGDAPARPRMSTTLDLSALRERLAAQIAAAENEDPALLRRRIEDLQRQLRERPVETVVERVEVPVLRAGEAERLAATADNMAAMGKDMLAVAGEIRAALATVSPRPEAPAPEPASRPVPPPPKPAAPAAQERRATHRAAPTPKPAPTAVSDRALLPDAQRRLLDTLAAFEALGVRAVHRKNAAVWSNISPTSSALDNHLARLEGAGLVAYPSGGFVALTDAGRKLAQATPAPATVAELHAAWLRHLPTGPRAFLRALLDYRKREMLSVPRVPLAVAADFSATSSSVDKHLAALKELGLVHYPKPGTVAATDLLFPNLEKKG